MNTQGSVDIIMPLTYSGFRLSRMCYNLELEWFIALQFISV